MSSRSKALVPTQTAPLNQVSVLTPGERLVQAFLRGRSPRTMLAYRKDLENFAKFLGTQTIDEAASKLLVHGHGPANGLVLDYQAQLLEEKKAPATINRRIAAIRSLIHIGNLLDLVTWKIDVENVKSSKYRDTAGPGETVVSQIFQELRGRPGVKSIRDRAIVHLLFDLALRRGEVVSLDCKHVDLKAGTISVMGKGRRERVTIKMPASTCKALAAWSDVRDHDSDAFFFALDPRTYGHRLVGQSIYAIVKEAGDKVGSRARPHGLRHTAITSALDKTNGNKRAVQRFSRHLDGRTLDLYDDNRTDMAGEVAALVAGGVSDQ